ncbi:hypothetical protein E1J38_002380 [Seonamhaeicola sediminis]|uniref:Uncharacterized protein n=1 Tax=Seonamhaeicola sediminis TaxID=2528206 RepID=A0A562YI36_9FLAO|nr:hypothetical protein E1J38_002380 [Seonamhaeicola sediminis]
MPFIIVVTVNELVRPTIKDKGFELRGVKAINTDEALTDRCTWYCYKETSSHCKVNHATFLKPYFKFIDPIYFGIIKSMHSGGNYQFMNIIFLVILIPLLIFVLMVRAIEMGYRIKALKKNL